MVPTTATVPKLKNLPPHVIEVQSSMCQIFQPQQPQPIARWILEEGQVLGVLIATFPPRD
ncbi:MAG: hypothetical protein AAF959_05345 [Cyanobacteria bacterium P01_D01_bin.56]